MKIEERKVQEIAGSLLITLPKSWTNQFKVKKGAVISLVIGDDGSLKFNPKIQEEEKEEKVGIKLDKYIIRKLFREYLLGKNIIEIFSDKPITKAERDHIIWFLKRLINTEIVEEDSKRIVIENFGSRRIPIKQAFIRMVYLTNAMFEDILDYENNLSVLKTLEERDENVDKFYFMVVASTRAYISKGIYALPEKEVSLLECMDYRLAAEKVERAGDLLKKIAKLLKGYKNKDVLDFAKLVHERSVKAVRAFMKKDLETAFTLLDDAKELRKKAESLKRKLEKKNDIKGIELVESFLQIFEHGKDIGDLVR